MFAAYEIGAINERNLHIFDFANAPIGELEDAIKTTGFFHNKARNIKLACHNIISDHGGGVPKTMEELVEFGRCRLTGLV